jgi:hypothetical protein
MVIMLTMIDRTGMTMFKRAEASHTYLAFNSVNKCWRLDAPSTFTTAKSFCKMEIAGSTLNSNKKLAKRYTSKGGTRNRNSG